MKIMHYKGQQFSVPEVPLLTRMEAQCDAIRKSCGCKSRQCTNCLFDYDKPTPERQEAFVHWEK